MGSNPIGHPKNMNKKEKKEIPKRKDPYLAPGFPALIKAHKKQMKRLGENLLRGHGVYW